MTLAVPSATLVTSVTRVTPGQPPWLPTLPTPWVAGERDPKVLADMARGPMRAKTSRLEEAFTGRFTDHHAFLLRTMLARVDGIDADVERVQARIDEQIAPFAAAVTRLDEIPGVGVTIAQVIIAESRARYDPVPDSRPFGVLGPVRARDQRISGPEKGWQQHRQGEPLPRQGAR